jgi:hypothetical protein
MSDLIKFYAGQSDYPYHISDIWEWSDDHIEDIHNWIQFVFPNKEPSNFNPDAPLITDEEISTISYFYLPRV